MPERSEQETANFRAFEEWYYHALQQGVGTGIYEAFMDASAYKDKEIERLDNANVTLRNAAKHDAELIARLKAELAEARKETDRLNRWIQDHCYVEDGLTTEAALSAAQKKIHILTAERDEARKLVAEFRVLLTLCKQAAAEDEIQSSSLLEGMREADTALAALEGKEGANG